LEILSNFEILPILIIILILFIEILLANIIDYFIYSHAPSVMLFAFSSTLANVLFVYLFQNIVLSALTSLLVAS
jgi:hypothetical protein